MFDAKRYIDRYIKRRLDDKYLIFHIINRLEDILSVCFALSKKRASISLYKIIYNNKQLTIIFRSSMQKTTILSNGPINELISQI